MAIADLIGDLQELSAPDRKLDISIALATGYRRKVESSDGERKVTWFHGHGVVTRIPKFTECVGAAYELATQLFPNRTGGCSWDETGRGNAVVEGVPICSGASPAIALCIAILSAIDLHERDE